MPGEDDVVDYGIVESRIEVQRVKAPDGYGFDEVIRLVSTYSGARVPDEQQCRGRHCDEYREKAEARYSGGHPVRIGNDPVGL
jgi:hypothetical protein